MQEDVLVVPEFSDREVILQQLIDAAERERRRHFTEGEQIAKLVRIDGKTQVAFKSAASALGCSARHAAQLYAVFTTFGWAAYDPMLPYALYRACCATDNPNYWLGRAQQSGWNHRDLIQQYHKETGKEVDPESVGVTLLARGEGEVEIEPDRITIRMSQPASVLPGFKQGTRAKVRIETRR